MWKRIPGFIHWRHKFKKRKIFGAINELSRDCRWNSLLSLKKDSRKQTETLDAFTAAIQFMGVELGFENCRQAFPYYIPTLLCSLTHCYDTRGLVCPRRAISEKPCRLKHRNKHVSRNNTCVLSVHTVYSSFRRSNVYRMQIHGFNPI